MQHSNSDVPAACVRCAAYRSCPSARADSLPCLLRRCRCHWCSGSYASLPARLNLHGWRLPSRAPSPTVTSSGAAGQLLPSSRATFSLSSLHGWQRVAGCYRSPCSVELALFGENHLHWKKTKRFKFQMYDNVIVFWAKWVSLCCSLHRLG